MATKNWHGQDSRDICDLEGYAQMEWSGRFNNRTPFRFFRVRPDLGEYVSKWTDGVTLFRTLEANREALESFADDLCAVKRPPSTPYDALRLADSVEAFCGL